MIMQNQLIFSSSNRSHKKYIFFEEDEYEDLPNPPDQGVDAGAPGTVDEMSVDQYWLLLILSSVLLFGYLQRK